MRAVNFMKIDYIRTKQQMYLMPVFCAIAVALGSKNYSPMIGFSYMAFLGLIFSTAPFGLGQASEAGFLALLPSRTGDRVLGRFLYGISLVLLSVATGGVTILLNVLMGQIVKMWMLAVSLVFLAVCICMMTFEFLFLYLAGGYIARNLVNIVRIVPGMGVFFFMMHTFGKVEEGEAAFGRLDLSMLDEVGGQLMRAGSMALLTALIVLAAGIVVCVKVAEKRDYV